MPKSTLGVDNRSQNRLPVRSRSLLSPTGDPMEPGSLLRAARTGAGVALRELARRTHYAVGYLSQIETGQRPVSAEIVAAYETALDVHLDRLAAVSAAPGAVDAETLDDAAAILAATRRIEDSAGPVAVLAAVRGLGAMAETLARDAPRARVATAVALASELAQYRGWLEFATGADAAAQRSFVRAVYLARESGNPDRLVHGLSFSAFAALANSEYRSAAELSEAALAVRGAHPLIVVFEHYQRARIQAALGAEKAAERALLVADDSAARAAHEERPSAGYWYGPEFFALQRGRVLRTLGREDQARREVQAAVAALPPEQRRASWMAKWTRAADGTADIPH
ncbi:helix-turn-helix transcriptional regulator [Nocardia sp. NPDC050697]|uniref:helix-turn-helix domain-containing protein n=1 Tax=Nocardia sp. NPDC050697 TaxID=3155158 RepID=UPI003406F57A